MTAATCPVCGSAAADPVLSHGQVGLPKYGCSLVRCRACQHVFTRIDGAADLSQLYANEQYELVDTRRSIFGRLIAFDVGVILKELQRIKPAVRGRKALLDFGSGKGVFLHGAAQQGWLTTGVETAARRAAFARERYGLNIITTLYDGGALEGGPFDVISLFHVLEHLPAPKQLVKQLVDDNLRSDGVLVLEVPRFDSLQSRIAGAGWIHLDAPRHLSHFSSAGLRDVVGALGMQVVVEKQWSLHNALLGMVQALMGRFGYRKMLIEELKFRRTIPLLAAVAAVLPLAAVLEIVASVFRRGGVIRVYCRRGQGT